MGTLPIPDPSDDKKTINPFQQSGAGCVVLSTAVQFGLSGIGVRGPGVNGFLGVILFRMGKTVGSSHGARAEVAHQVLGAARQKWPHFGPEFEGWGGVGWLIRLRLGPELFCAGLECQCGASARCHDAITGWCCLEGAAGFGCGPWLGGLMGLRSAGAPSDGAIGMDGGVHAVCTKPACGTGGGVVGGLVL